jgi:allophanate hydrolase subunit 2
VGVSAAGEVGAYLRSPPQYAASVRLRILPGPHQDWFTPAALRAIREAAFGISPQSDRTGVRLEGVSLERVRAGELPSMGMTTGAMQVPSSGQSIILLGNHGTTGGYPVIASVIAADLHLLAQLPAGAQIRFEEVSIADALEALARQETRLQQDIVAADASLLAARGMMTLAAKHASLRQAAVTDGNRRIRIRK